MLYFFVSWILNSLAMGDDFISTKTTYTGEYDLIHTKEWSHTPDGLTFHTEKYDLGHAQDYNPVNTRTTRCFFLSFFHFTTYLRSDDQFIIILRSKKGRRWTIEWLPSHVLKKVSTKKKWNIDNSMPWGTFAVLSKLKLNLIQHLAKLFSTFLSVLQLWLQTSVH